MEAATLFSTFERQKVVFFVQTIQVQVQLGEKLQI